MTKDEVIKEFRATMDMIALYRQWDDDTQYLSSTTAIMEHPAVQKLKDMGERALKHSLLRMQCGEASWGDIMLVGILAGLRGPAIPPHMRGKYYDICNLYIKWGIRNGFADARFGEHIKVGKSGDTDNSST